MRYTREDGCRAWLTYGLFRADALHDLLEEYGSAEAIYDRFVRSGGAFLKERAGENGVTKLAEQADKLETEYRRRLFEIRKKRFEIITLLEKIDDAECHDLLCQRYIRCLRWEQIAVNMEKSYQWVAGPLHSKALQLVARLLSE